MGDHDHRTARAVLGRYCTDKRCGICRLPFRPTDLVENEEGATVHACCAGEAAEARAAGDDDGR